MIHLIVGHRGTGKTAFLKRVQVYYSELNLNIVTIDLDKEIEKATNLTIADIFSEQGEKSFRQLETQVLGQLIEKYKNTPGHIYIAVGAGYEGEENGLCPHGVEVLWLRRETDKLGRIFLDRPRLNTDVTPLEEYQARYIERNNRYKKWCHREVIVPEGWDHTNEWEMCALGLKPALINYSITVLPEHFLNTKRLSYLLQDGLAIGVKYFELRDDLLSPEQIHSVLSQIPMRKALLSFRKFPANKELVYFWGKNLTKLAVDWPVEFGKPPFTPDISSLHERLPQEKVSDFIERMKKAPGQIRKLAVPIESFEELEQGHRFHLENKEQNVFLPTSNKGRWKWYRLLTQKNMALKFCRMGDGSSADQPLLLDVLKNQFPFNHFAAVLGEPVIHSHTPAVHYKYFLKHQMPVFAISMSEEECQVLNFKILERLGLCAAAVTSPLKNTAIDLCALVDKKADELHAVNTIILNPSTQTWTGSNTDVTGLRNIKENLEWPAPMAVWGGGGTRNVVREVWPNAIFYSARYAEPLFTSNPEELLDFKPQTVIWAVPNNRMATSQWPNPHWQPEVVFDLSYAENSLGREYALKVGAHYYSGRAFFKSQAQAQEQFWDNTGFLNTFKEWYLTGRTNKNNRLNNQPDNEPNNRPRDIQL